MRTHIYLLALLVILAGCYKESDYEPQKRQLDDILGIVIQNSAIPADSVSTSAIYFSLPVEVDSARLSVKVKTNLGTFLESGSNIATVTLKYSTDSLKNIGVLTLKSNSKPAKADIQFDYETTVQHKQVEFTRAYPEDISISTASLSIKPTNNGDGETTITAKLTRSTGVPSQRTEVNIDVYDAAYSRKLGVFKAKSKYTDQNGIVQSVFVLGDSLVNNLVYQGVVNIVGSTKNADSATITDTLQLFSTK